ncbi:hypothetical protein [Marinilabilia salmonicolor]|uniref:hypothetical protein n=1 Tax=Marinilabilia salmonicolor TaxID=989 RepID=UPI000299EDB4|nr:hypothetical protein [Marinilabilia salmonicolor]
MRSVILLVLPIISVISCCNSNGGPESYHRDYTHKEKTYYPNGNVEYEKRWNIRQEGDDFLDEELLYFSEDGDTLSRRIEFVRQGVFLRYNQDTIDYRFFRAWMPNFINEMLTVNRNLKVYPDESLYMYVAVLEDSLKFSFVGRDMLSYEIQLFETTKVKLEEPDFVFMAEDAKPLFIPKTTLSDHQIIRIEYLRDKVFEGDTGKVRQGFTTLFSLYEKLELQKMLGMKEICEPYLSN